MLTDVGEYIVGAHLQLIEGCDFIDYNVRIPGGGLSGLSELDVVGLNFNTKTAFLCEVTTHIRGLNYGSYQTTIEKIRSKHQHQLAYANAHLSQFQNFRYMLWSPRVSVGNLTTNLAAIEGLELVINGEYKRRINELKALAANTTHDARNPFFRILQILEHMRD